MYWTEDVAQLLRQPEFSLFCRESWAKQKQQSCGWLHEALVVTSHEER